MITSSNIYNAIKTRLKQIFKAAELQIKDIKNITPPCLYIQYVNSSDKEVANETYNTTCLFNIVYFADAGTLLNLLDVENRLKKAFKKAIPVYYVNNFGETVRKFIKPEVNSDPEENTEYILSVSLSFDFIQDADIDYINGANDEFDTGEYDNPETMDILDLD